MDTEQIIAELEAERDRLDQAIAALQGSRRRKRGTRPAVRTVPTIMRRGRRHLSAAARRKIAIAAKRRWAKAKATGRNSL